METLSEKIIRIVVKQPGITDRSLAEAIFGSGTPQQRVNNGCRLAASRGKISRRMRDDGLIGNFPADETSDKPVVAETPIAQAPSIFSEDNVKKTLEAWLVDQGWSVTIAWGRSRGIDIQAIRNDERWLIEAKGEGSLNAMRVNYFLSMLGEILQRMNDPANHYSIALPDLQQFRNLWSRLPSLAKQRTMITALFVTRDGKVEEVG